MAVHSPAESVQLLKCLRMKSMNYILQVFGQSIVETNVFQFGYTLGIFLTIQS